MTTQLQGIFDARPASTSLCTQSTRQAPRSRCRRNSCVAAVERQQQQKSADRHISLASRLQTAGNALALTALLASASVLTPSPVLAGAESTEAGVGVIAGSEAALENERETTERENSSSQQVFLEVKVESEVKGRIRVALFPDVSTGSRRFADLAQGKKGVGYRLSKIDTLAPNFIASSGVRSLSYGADTDDNISALQQLEAEMAENARPHDKAGMVSLVIRDSKPRQLKERLTAKNGKLVTVKEQIGDTSNGTAFNITLRPAPELDATSLAVGRVTEGMDVVQELAKLPAVRNQSNSVFFKAAKFAGDKRADVAEKAFGKPFVKVIISSCGLL